MKNLIVLDLGCNNPLAFQHHDEKLVHGHNSCWLTLDSSANITCEQSTVMVPVCQHAVVLMIRDISLDVLIKWWPAAAATKRLWTVRTKTRRPIYCKHSLYPTAQRSCWGVYWFHSVRLSVRPASRVRSVSPRVLVGSTSDLYILARNFRCVACNVSCNISKF